jgi:hypothetical protein
MNLRDDDKLTLDVSRPMQGRGVKIGNRMRVGWIISNKVRL